MYLPYYLNKENLSALRKKAKADASATSAGRKKQRVGELLDGGGSAGGAFILPPILASMIATMLATILLLIQILISVNMTEIDLNNTEDFENDEE